MSLRRLLIFGLLALVLSNRLGRVETVLKAPRDNPHLSAESALPIGLERFLIHAKRAWRASLAAVAHRLDAFPVRARRTRRQQSQLPPLSTSRRHRCSLPLRPHYFLESTDLGVLSLDDGVAGSKKIERNSCAPVGGCIRLAGTGCSLTGEALGCPLVAQPQIASAQLSDNAISLSLRILIVLFVLLGDGLVLLGLGVFGCPSLLRCLQGNVQLGSSRFGLML